LIPSWQIRFCIRLVFILFRPIRIALETQIGIKQYRDIAQYCPLDEHVTIVESL